MPKLFALLFTLCLSLPALADWKLDNESSRIAFVFTQDEHQAEVGRFYGLLGGVADDGRVELRVEIDSLRTGVLARDQRLRKDLFDSAQYPFAEVAARLDPLPIIQLAPGAQMELRLPLRLRLGDVERLYEAELLVTRLDDHRFQVVTQVPLLLDAGDLALRGAVQHLREQAGLQSISLAVPVSAVLIFSRL